MHEKRKLEMQIWRDNQKTMITQKILSMVDQDGRESPKPKYRFEEIHNKYTKKHKSKNTHKKLQFQNA